MAHSGPPDEFTPGLPFSDASGTHGAAPDVLFMLSPWKGAVVYERISQYYPAYDSFSARHA